MSAAAPSTEPVRLSGDNLGTGASNPHAYWACVACLKSTQVDLLYFFLFFGARTGAFAYAERNCGLPVVDWFCGCQRWIGDRTLQGNVARVSPGFAGFHRVVRLAGIDPNSSPPL